MKKMPKFALDSENRIWFYKGNIVIYSYRTPEPKTRMATTTARRSPTTMACAET